MRKYDRLAERVLRILVRRKLVPQKTALARVDVFLTDNRVMRKLKKEFLKKDAKVVDVLSFPEDPRFPDPEKKGLYLGEIHLNRAIARRSAKRAEYLFIHGFLHLLGYSHSGKRDTIEMEKLEQELLEDLKKR